MRRKSRSQTTFFIFTGKVSALLQTVLHPAARTVLDIKSHGHSSCFALLIGLFASQSEASVTLAGFTLASDCVAKPI